MSTDSFTLPAIGRRLRAVAEQSNEIDERMTGPDYHAVTLRLYDEDRALQELGLAIWPRTAEDVAVQLGLLFLDLGRITAFELAANEQERHREA
jgi:hypothetical protein